MEIAVGEVKTDTGAVATKAKEVVIEAREAVTEARELKQQGKSSGSIILTATAEICRWLFL